MTSEEIKNLKEKLTKVKSIEKKLSALEVAIKRTEDFLDQRIESFAPILTFGTLRVQFADIKDNEIILKLLKDKRTILYKELEEL
jgi:hypothetical protein